VLVTGATGFIGRRVLSLLAAGRASVIHALSRRPLADGDARWHEADLSDHERVRRILAEVRPTHLLHLAWDTAHGSYYTSPDNVRWLADSLVLVDAFIRMGGRRLVGAGSAAEYDLTTGADLSEATTALRPNGLYGECKKSLWEVCSRYARQAGIGSAWGRIFFCYGPGEDPSRTVPTLIRRLLRGDRVPFQEGLGYRDYVHVDDVAEAFAMLTTSDLNGAVNIGSGQAVRLRDLAARIATEVGRPEALRFGEVPTPQYEPARVVADVARVTSELGWRPRRSLAEGIRETVAWWRARDAAPVGTGRPA